MAADMLYELIMGGVSESLGSQMLIGAVLIFVVGILIMATGVPILGAFAIEFAFIVGLVTQGWIPLWVKGVFALVLGIVLYFSIGAIFKAE
jgi:hypothetical protein